jgi:hypothetical protein
MLAFQISINGEVREVCGEDALQHLVAYIRAQAPDGQELNPTSVNYFTQCFGFPASGAEVVKWSGIRLALGDEISVKLVETKDAHAPTDRQSISRSEPNES